MKTTTLHSDIKTVFIFKTVYIEVIQFLAPEKYPIKKKLKEKANNTPTFSEKSDNYEQGESDQNMIIQQGEDIIEMNLEQVNQMIQDPQTSIETLIQMLSL